MLEDANIIDMARRDGGNASLQSARQEHVGARARDRGRNGCFQPPPAQIRT